VVVGYKYRVYLKCKAFSNVPTVTVLAPTGEVAIDNLAEIQDAPMSKLYDNASNSYIMYYYDFTPQFIGNYLIKTKDDVSEVAKSVYATQAEEGSNEPTITFGGGGIV
jgi:hypothetical protein